MTDCEKSLELMMLALDGALDAEATKELEEHIDSCERCRALYQTYREIDAGILEMEEEPPEGLTEAVMGAIRHEKERSSPVYFIKRAKFTILAAAACLALVLVGRTALFGDSIMSGSGMDAPVARTEAAPVESTAAPMEGAAFMTVMDTEETSLGEAYKEEIDGSGTVGTASAGQVLAALEKDNRTGDLVVLSGISADGIFDLFDTVWILDIPDGFRVYRVLREDFEAVMDQLVWSDVVSTNPPGEDVYLYPGE